MWTKLHPFPLLARTKFFEKFEVRVDFYRELTNNNKILAGYPRKKILDIKSEKMDERKSFV